MKLQTMRQRRSRALLAGLGEGKTAEQIAAENADFYAHLGDHPGGTASTGTGTPGATVEIVDHYQPIQPDVVPLPAPTVTRLPMPRRGAMPTWAWVLLGAGLLLGVVALTRRDA